MNINETLFEQCKDYFPNYDCESDDIKAFLFDNLNRKSRQAKAHSIMKNILEHNEKKFMLKFLLELADIEPVIQELQEKIRDHVVHSLLVYITGIYINEKMMPKIGKKIHPFPLKIACLLHDISYPIEIARNIIDSYSCNINKILADMPSTHHNISININPNNIIKLQKVDKFGNQLESFKLIKECFVKWGLKIDPKKEYYSVFKTGKVCHGMLSSLSILFLIDQMYQLNNRWRKSEDKIIKDGYRYNNFNEKHFNDDIVHACSALFLHNFNEKIFIGNKINPRLAPEAFLLKLCDSLQEWQRPNIDSVDGERAESFDIDVENSGKLIFYAESLQENRKRAIENTIKSSLDSMDYFEIF